MIARAILAFLILPGTMAGLIPWALSGLRHPGFSIARSSYGLVPLLFGAAILVAAVVSFYRRGLGTLAPWDPPRRLVVQDLYRFNRNPMYVGVLLIVLGWFLLSGSPWMLLYAILLATAFHLRVVLYEEGEMRRLFGEQWERYRRSVPRWGIRLTPYRAPDS